VFDKILGITKEKMLKEMNRRNVPCRPVFYPLSSLDAISNNSYCDAGWAKKENLIAYDISNRGVNLPGSLEMTDKDLKLVAEKFKYAIDTLAK
jgi:dTDP-4-amino-4,6-dideoxygalactose transaminase